MSDQVEMFPDFENEWQKEWHQMPEFLQENTEPIQQIIVSFQTYHHVKLFGELMNQNVSAKTKSLWYPKKETAPPSMFLYVDEDVEDQNLSS